MKLTAQREDSVLRTIPANQRIRWQQAIAIVPEADPVEVFKFWKVEQRKSRKTILKHLEGILGYWASDRLTNAFMEGLLRVFSAAKRKARGYRTFSNLRNTLYFTASNLKIPL